MRNSMPFNCRRMKSARCETSNSNTDCHAVHVYSTSSVLRIFC